MGHDHDPHKLVTLTTKKTAGCPVNYSTDHATGRLSEWPEKASKHAFPDAKIKQKNLGRGNCPPQ